MKHAKLIAVACACLIGASCGQQEERAFREEYYRVSDSIVAGAPSARALVEKHIAEAKDSDEYYAWLTQRSRCLSIANADSANIVADQVLDFMRRHEPTPRRKAYEASAWIYKIGAAMAHDPAGDSAVACGERSYRAITESDNERRLPEVCATVGNVEMARGRLVDAARWYRRGLVKADSLGQPRSKNYNLLYQLSTLYMYMGDDDKAEEYFKELESMLDSMPPQLQLMSLNNYATLLNLGDRSDEALGKLRLMDAKMSGTPFDASLLRPICDVNMAESYLHLDNLAKASERLDSAERLFAAAGSADGLMNVKALRVGIATKGGRLDEAARTMAAGGDPNMSNDVSIRQTWAKTAGEYYLKRGDYRNAFLCQQRYAKTNDSISRANARMQAADLQEQYKTDSLAMSNQVLRREKAEQQTQTIVGVVVALALIALLGMALALKSISWKRRRLQGEMENMKLRLGMARSYISPHFIFNVLSSQMPKDANEQSEPMMKLVSLLRSNIDNARKTNITLREELDFVDKYIDVQRNIVEGGLDYSVRTTDDRLLDQTIVPSMFVQILVENALIHGLRGKKELGRIAITVSESDGCTLVTIEDNGRGFDATRITSAEGGRVGLAIIRKSIAVLNEENKWKTPMRFRIENIADADGSIKGCRSMLLLPPRKQL